MSLRFLINEYANMSRDVENVCCGVTAAWMRRARRSDSEFWRWPPRIARSHSALSLASQRSTATDRQQHRLPRHRSAGQTAILPRPRQLLLASFGQPGGTTDRRTNSQVWRKVLGRSPHSRTSHLENYERQTQHEIVGLSEREGRPSEG